jgi:hypothetical protein
MTNCAELYDLFYADKPYAGYFFVDEMKKRLSAANLEPLKFFAGFDKQQPITDETWHIVAVARKS